MKTTWIVIADGAKADFYAYEGPTRPLKLIEDGQLSHINEPSRELVTTERGRMKGNSLGQRSAIERSTDPHEYEKFKFAREISAFLSQREQEVDCLVIAAAPRMLGDLRRLLPDAVQAKVTAELSSNLTNIPLQELPRHLQSVLNIDARPARPES